MEESVSLGEPQEPTRQPSPATIVLPVTEPLAQTQKPALQPETAVGVTENIFSPELEGRYKDTAKKPGIYKIIAGVAVISVLLIAALVFVVLPKATVVVYPKTENVDRDMIITMGANISAIDPSQLVMPAQKIDQTITVNDKFQSQGKLQVGNNAEGTVKIYNFTKEPINLKAATTVLTLGGNTYNLVNDVVGLKPTTYSNATTKEVNPASLGESVPIVAAQGGDSYNIPAGTRLEITNQVFGSRPQLLYAKTDTPVAGGTTRYLSVISQDDTSGAQTQLQSEALAQVRLQLQNSGEELADGAYSVSISNFNTDSPAGTQTPSFNASLQVQLAGLVFKQSDLTSLISQRISQTLDTNKSLAEGAGQSTVSYSATNLDINNQSATLSVIFKGEAVYNLDLGGMAAELTGKSLAQVNRILTANDAVDKVEMTLAPVWQKNFPFLASKINITEGEVAPVSSN